MPLIEATFSFAVRVLVLVVVAHELHEAEVERAADVRLLLRLACRDRGCAKAAEPGDGDDAKAVFRVRHRDVERAGAEAELAAEVATEPVAARAVFARSRPSAGRRSRRGCSAGSSRSSCLGARAPPRWTLPRAADAVVAEGIEDGRGPERRHVVAAEAQFTRVAVQADRRATIPELARSSVPVSGLMPERRLKPAFRPPPRSSMPWKRISLLLTPSVDSAELTVDGHRS